MLCCANKSTFELHSILLELLNEKQYNRYKIIAIILIIIVLFTIISYYRVK